YHRVPPHVKVLAWLDTDSYEGSKMPGKHPAIWCHQVDLGRAIYTAGGHTDASFSEPLFLQHLTGALYWAAGHDDWKPSQSETKPEKKSPTPEKKEKSGA
ncbi:MAG: ThuA domain-containing protein, partial [Planctomycetota bacterium]